MITTIIIAVTVIASLSGFKNRNMLSRWMFNAWKIRNLRQYDRFLLSGFIHNDWMHLVFNMFTLYFLGRGVEIVFIHLLPNGRVLFVVFYLSAIIISSIPSFIKHRDHEFYNSLGASGGVSALVFGFIILQPLVPLCLFGLLCLPGFILGALYIIYSYQMGKKTSDNINHDAHLWGAIYGFVFILIVRPESFPEFIEKILSYSIF